MWIRLKVLAAAGLFAGLLAAPSHAWGWGKDGHDLVGKIADKFLTLKARKAVNELVHGSQFKSLGDGGLPNWADAIRGSKFFNNKYKGMGNWHFVDIDVTMAPPAPLPEKDTVIGAIKRFRGDMVNPKKTLTDRREALFFIAHFIGDIHQPLHCAERDSDRGGNEVHVRVLGDDPHTTNLHKVWDVDLVEEAMGGVSTTDYAARLVNGVSNADRKKHAAGKLEDWILESHQIAKASVYTDGGKPIPVVKGKPHRLSDDYMTNGAEIVELQLLRGGIRLAQVLNDTLK